VSASIFLERSFYEIEYAKKHWRQGVNVVSGKKMERIYAEANPHRL
jgi:hypothetical protein